MPNAMQGVAEAGQVLLSSTERRLEITSHNVANISTPGYKRQVSYADIVSALNASSQTEKTEQSQQMTQADLAQGKMRQTKNPLDIAIVGDGFFQVRASENSFYTRRGQFKLTSEGTLVTSQGFVLQGDGGDIILSGPDAEILDDGTILEDGLPTSRIALFRPAEESHFHSVSGSLFESRNGEAEIVERPMLRQGFVESSNVKMTDEMVTMMAAMRQAETGAKLIQTYDELIGRALSTFGLQTR